MNQYSKLILNWALMALPVLALVGCGSDDEPEDMAAALCDCLKENGLESEDDYSIGFGLGSGGTQRKFRDCFQEIEPDLKKGLEDATDRPGYFKEFIKSVLDTDCALDALKSLPYEQIEGLSRSDLGAISTENKEQVANLNQGQ